MASLTHAQALTDPTLTVLQDIALSVARAGVRRLLIPNGHAGNRALLDLACRDLRASQTTKST